VLGDLFYHLGAAVGELGAQLSGKAGAENGHGGIDVDGNDTDSDEHDLLDGVDSQALGHTGELVAGAAGAWLVTRVLRPSPVSWTRVVIAGVAATFLADLAARTLDDRQPDRATPADEPEALLQRFGAGIAIAAGYASLLYPRLPGPPLLRGLAFGVFEVAASSRGGLVRMAAGTPGLRFPLQGLALPLHDEAGPASHMAFGLGLGLFYRPDS
jgi:hypothetical protein